MLALGHLLVALLVLQAAPDQARELYDEGERQFELGEYDRAIAAFERAYELSHAADLLFNIAQAHRLKGPASCREALGFYERYLREAPAASNRVETQERIAQMKSCVEEPPPTRTQVPGPAPAQPPAPPGGAATGPSPWRTVGWVAVGVGGAAAVLTIVAGSLAYDQQSDLDRLCPGGGCPRSARSELDHYQTLQGTATVGLIVGVVATGTGLVLLWRSPASPRRATAEPWVSTNGFGLRGTF
jgi:tetratricopeptide (TPR) repeat protein